MATESLERSMDIKQIASADIEAPISQTLLADDCSNLQTELDIKRTCRTCLQDVDSYKDIFEDRVDADNRTLAEHMTELTQLTYKKLPNIPSIICMACYANVLRCIGFVSSSKEIEDALQERHKTLSLENMSLSERPGLNGNLGTFLPDKDCIVIVVDPKATDITSDDEFSLDSDTDDNDIQNNAAMRSQSQISTKFHNGQQSQHAVMPLSPHNDNFANVTASSNNTAAALQQIKLSANANSTTTVGESHLTTTITNSTQATTSTASATKSNSLASSSLDYIRRNTYFCEFCDMAFPKQTDCKAHEEEHNKIRPFRCVICNWCAILRQDLTYHIKQVHETTRPYLCVLCQKGFCRRSDLKKHAIVHTGVRPFECQICFKSFSRNTNLTKHLKIHQADRPYVCSSCPRVFSTFIEMVKHKKVHENTNTIACERCPSQFARKDQFVAHMQMHYRRDSELQASILMPPPAVPSLPLVRAATPAADLTQNNFLTESAVRQESTTTCELQNSVPQAQSQAAMPSILAAQLQRHTNSPALKQGSAAYQLGKSVANARSLNCEYCSKTFTRECDFQRHQALHLNKLLTCQICELGFNRVEKLRRHMNEMHSIKFTCKYCFLHLQNDEELKSHVMSQHAAQLALETQKPTAMLMPQLNASEAAATGAASATAAAATAAVDNSSTNSMLMPSNNEAATTFGNSLPANNGHYVQLMSQFNLGFYNETRPDAADAQSQNN